MRMGRGPNARGRTSGRFVARVAGAVLLGGVLVAAAGCAIEKPDQAPIPSAEPVFVSRLAQPALSALAPLRGTPLQQAAPHPSLAAKVDNHEEARPQYGLERADIVFEEMVEGGLTRYVAVWHSDIPDSIGPVRSIRPMDPDIISPFGGIVAYSGGQEIFVDMMRDTVVYNAIHGMDDTEETFTRTDERDAPHDVVVDAPSVVGQHLDLAPPAPQFAFSVDVASATATKDGAPTSRVDTVFSEERYPFWQWDGARAQYLRFQEGEPDLDTAGIQIGATNVVAMRVGIDWTYGYIPKTIMVGSGEAFVSTGGGTIHATWSKADRGAPIRLVDDSGTTIRLAPGGTWIELVPDDGEIRLTP